MDLDAVLWCRTHECWITYGELADHIVIAPSGGCAVIDPVGADHMVMIDDPGPVLVEREKAVARWHALTIEQRVAAVVGS